jgi:hypothetical protein
VHPTKPLRAQQAVLDEVADAAGLEPEPVGSSLNGEEAGCANGRAWRVPSPGDKSRGDSPGLSLTGLDGVKW